MIDIKALESLENLELEVLKHTVDKILEIRKSKVESESIGQNKKTETAPDLTKKLELEITPVHIPGVPVHVYVSPFQAIPHRTPPWDRTYIGDRISDPVWGHNQVTCGVFHG